MAASVHTDGKVRRFGTVRCRIYCWLMCCKNCQNRSRFALVILKVYYHVFVDHSVVAWLLQNRWTATARTASVLATWHMHTASF